MTVKGYGTQFVRDYSLQLFPSSAFLPRDPAVPGDPGGLHFGFPGQQVFRFGGTADVDVNLPFNIRLLAGGEFFYEGLRQSNATFTDPTNANSLPLLCPVQPDGMGGFSRIPLCPRIYGEDTGRYVAAGYVDAQWRPFQKLTLDGGVRIQKGFGDLPYALVPLGSAAIVYNFLPDYHVKLNYATGFRAPVFQNTSIPAGGVSFGANPNLQTEASQSFQGELNGATAPQRPQSPRARGARRLLVHGAVEPHPDPRRRLRQHRQARHPLGRGLRQAVPHRRPLPAGVVHLPQLDVDRRRRHPHHAEPLGRPRRLVQPRQEPARPEHEPGGLRRLRGSEPRADGVGRRGRRRHRIRRHDDGAPPPTSRSTG